jgi:1-acyl-sn-glycerol-3-phosphate acyltransferase
MSSDGTSGSLPPGRARSVFDTALYDVAVAVLRVYVAVAHGLRVEGREHLAAVRGSAITISNHVHYLDCAMVAGQSRERRVAFTAKRENFSLPVAGFLVTHLGAVATPGSPREVAAFEAQLRVRSGAGEGVHFYPEGELVPYDATLRPFRLGAFTYACRLGLPVVPMVFTYGPRRWWRWRPPLRLTILEAERPAGTDHADAVELMARCRDAMGRHVLQG